MNIWNTILPMVAGYVANAAGNKAALWGKNLALQSMVVKEKEPAVTQKNPGTAYTSINPNQQAVQMMGVDDDNWTRRELRRFRKGMGMGKLEFRNWKAELMGLDPNRNYSRKDIKALERAHNITSEVPLSNIYSKQYLDRAANIWEQTHRIVPIQELPEPEEEVIEEEPLPGQQAPSYFKTPGEMYLEYTQQRFGQKPLPFMLLPPLNLTPIPQTPITYNFGNNMNTYWANQAQKVLGNLTPEELYKISGNDGEINYDDAIAWLQGIGAGNDGKFGENTINAMNVRYLNTAMLDYKNPGNKLTSPNYVMKKDYTYNPKNYQISWGN